jgi:hypothetical protein
MLEGSRPRLRLSEFRPLAEPTVCRLVARA